MALHTKSGFIWMLFSFFFKSVMRTNPCAQGVFCFIVLFIQNLNNSLIIFHLSPRFSPLEEPLLAIDHTRVPGLPKGDKSLSLTVSCPQPTFHQTLSLSHLHKHTHKKRGSGHLLLTNHRSVLLLSLSRLRQHV